MTNETKTSTKSSGIILRGYSNAKHNANKEEFKFETIKKNMLKNIKDNLDALKGKSIQPTHRIFNESRDYLVIKVRNGASPVFKNTVDIGTDKEEVLKYLTEMLNNGGMDKDIKRYIKSKSAKKTKSSKTKSISE